MLIVIAFRNSIRISVLSTLLSITVYPQDYEYIPMPDLGAIWSEVFYVPFDDQDLEDQYERYTITGEDTVINSLKYTKLYLFYDSVFNKETASCIVVIIESSAKVSGKFIRIQFI